MTARDRYCSFCGDARPRPPCNIPACPIKAKTDWQKARDFVVGELPTLAAIVGFGLIVCTVAMLFIRALWEIAKLIFPGINI